MPIHESVERDMPLEIPFDIRAGLDWIVSRNLNDELAVPAVLCGDDALTSHLARYARIDGSADTLIALSAEVSDLERNVIRLKPRKVYALARGTLQSVLGPLRRTHVQLSTDLAESTWNMLGYERVNASGFVGIRSLILMLLEHVFSAAGRPDLSDRCRVGFLQSVKVNRRVPQLACVTVREYRAIR